MRKIVVTMIVFCALSLTGCWASPVRNRGYDFLATVKINNNEFREYGQIKTGGVNGPDITLVIEKVCKADAAPNCEVVHIYEAQATGAYEAFIHGGLSGAFQGAGLAAFGALYDSSSYYNYATGGGGGAGGRGVGIGGAGGAAEVTINPPPMGMPVD